MQFIFQTLSCFKDVYSKTRQKYWLRGLFAVQLKLFNVTKPDFRSLDTFPYCVHSSACASQQTAAHTWHSNNHRTCLSSGSRLRVLPTPTTAALLMGYSNEPYDSVWLLKHRVCLWVAVILPFMTSTYYLVQSAFGNVADNEWSRSWLALDHITCRG